MNWTKKKKEKTKTKTNHEKRTKRATNFNYRLREICKSIQFQQQFATTSHSANNATRNIANQTEPLTKALTILDGRKIDKHADKQTDRQRVHTVVQQTNTSHKQILCQSVVATRILIKRLTLKRFPRFWNAAVSYFPFCVILLQLKPDLVFVCHSSIHNDGDGDSNYIATERHSGWQAGRQALCQ